MTDEQRERIDKAAAYLAKAQAAREKSRIEREAATAAYGHACSACESAEEELSRAIHELIQTAGPG